MRKFIPLTLTAVAALGLAACADNDDTADATPVETDTMAQPATDTMATDYTLSDEQQQRRDAADMQTLDTDVGGYYADTANWPQAGASWTLADLDRNNDGRLSPSEFAVYEIEANRTGNRPSVSPYFSPDELGTAVDRFYYFDANNDDYISDAEFATASQRMAGSMSNGMNDEEMMGMENEGGGNAMSDTSTMSNSNSNTGSTRPSN